MSTTTFANPIMLPWFKDDIEQEPVLCGGAIIHGYPYDGINKVELTPIRYDERFICAMEGNAIGQPYTIGQRHLDRLLMAANYVDGIYCEHCNGRRRKVTATVCCNVPYLGMPTLADIMAEVHRAATVVAREGVEHSIGGGVAWEATQWINAHLTEWQGMVERAREAQVRWSEMEREVLSA